MGSFQQVACVIDVGKGLRRTATDGAKFVAKQCATTAGADGQSQDAQQSALVVKQCVAW